MNKQAIYAGQPRGRVRWDDACRGALSVWTTWKREAVEVESLMQLLAAHQARDLRALTQQEPR